MYSKYETVLSRLYSLFEKYFCWLLVKRCKFLSLLSITFPPICFEGTSRFLWLWNFEFHNKNRYYSFSKAIVVDNYGFKVTQISKFNPNVFVYGKSCSYRIWSINRLIHFLHNNRLAPYIRNCVTVLSNNGAHIISNFMNL